MVGARSTATKLRSRVMGVKKKRLTLDLEPTFQRRLKVVAASRE